MFPTQKGRACACSGIAPSDAGIVLASMEQARRRFILKGGFHAIFLASPISSRIAVSWVNLETIVRKFSSEQPEQLPVLEYLGLEMEDLIKFRLKPPKNDCRDPKILFYRRLYCAIILYNVVHETPILKVADYLSLNRGDIQQLQKDASTHCGMTVVFARRLNWLHIASILESYSQRLCFGVRDDLLCLVRMGADMPAFRARAFHSCGYRNPEDIAKAKVEDIQRILQECSPFEEKHPLHLIQQKSPSSSSNLPLIPQHSEIFERLAKKIIHIAKETLKKDLQLLMSTTGLNNIRRN